MPESEDIRALARYRAGEVLKTGALCAIGNEEKIKADAAMFGSIQPLYHGTASDRRAVMPALRRYMGGIE